MENLVFTTFRDEKNAADGLKKLKELDQIGDIVIYNLALIEKNHDGTYTLLHHEGPEAADQPAQGALIGSLIGLLAGPVGMAVGMLTGGLAGAATGSEAEDVTQQFLDKANEQLSPGGLAIVLDVEEDTTFMIDTYMGLYQGITIHSPIDDEYEANDQAEWAELNTEIDEAEKELNSALDKDKAEVKVKLEALKAKKATVMEQMKEKAAKREKHWRDKLKELDKRISQASSETRQKLSKKISYLQSLTKQSIEK